VSQVTILAPLSWEARALRRGVTDEAEVVRTGMGPASSTRVSLPGSVGAVAVAGVCGALDPALRPGDVVVATEVRGPDGSIAPVPSAGVVAAALRAAGLDATLGPVASVLHLFRGVDRAALAAAGAIAVDMESAWLAGAAAGRPFAVVRVVADGPGRHLLRNPVAAARAGRTALRVLRLVGPALESWGRAAGPHRAVLAGPRSFCAGVERAIDIVDRALDRYGAPVYVRKQIVHNVHVVRDLERRGAVFVEGLDDVPRGALVVFSAHGVSPAVRDEARRRDLRVIDATCPLVTKVHAEARRFARAGYEIVLIGHRGHEEVEGTSGEAPDAIRLVERAEDLDSLAPGGGRLAYLTQTTLAVDEVEDVILALRARHPDLVGPGSEDICYATTNRQAAVRAIAREVDTLLVIGSRNSSNSRRLVEVAGREGCPAHLLDDETELDPAWLDGVRSIGITAGASAPELLVGRLLDALRGLGPLDVDERAVVDESVRFTLPAELRTASRRR
jgi:4-hydroxy-3-methylbut-2-en-1-yl diphosphate reductase